MARDATARQYDVDADAVRLDIAKGEVTFKAKRGRLVDLDKLHESIWATRLSGGTGMALNWLDVTAVGEVVVEKERLVLKEDDKKTFARLREAAERGQQTVSVTGRVEDWSGHFPPFLKTLPKRPRAIAVREFAPVK